MGNTKRWYIYVTSAVTLNAVTWGVITFLRNLFVGGFRPDVAEIAYQLAILLIGFPIYIIHWLWSQRLTEKDIEERSAFQRCLYLYIVLAGALGPILNSTFSLFEDGVIYGDRDAYVVNLISIVVLAFVYGYHLKVLDKDINALNGRAGAPSVRRLYVIGTTAVGLVMSAMASYTLLRWLFYQGGTKMVGSAFKSEVGVEIVRLIIGVVVWVIFWRWFQRLFISSKEEQAAVGRKAYLYLIVFISVVTIVSTAAGILASLIRRVIVGGVSSGDIRDAIPVLVVMGVLWAYHAYVLREDDGSVGTVPSQEGIRRAYLYLVAAVGFAALVSGLDGMLNVLIYSLNFRVRAVIGAVIGNELSRSLSWYIAVIMASIITWIVPWRGLHIETVEEDVSENLRSVPRRIYLYFFLFVSVMTLLSSLIYIVYQLLLILLGQRGGVGLFIDSIWAITGSIIAGIVLVCHGSILRRDGRLMEKEKRESLSEMRVTILDGGEGIIGTALKNAILDVFPGLEPSAIGLTTAAQEAMSSDVRAKDIPANLSDAKLIISPWNITFGLSEVKPDIAKALLTSPAKKLLLPLSEPELDWVGLEKFEIQELVLETVKAVKQIMAGAEVITTRRMGCASIVGIVVGLLTIFGLVAAVLNFFY